MSNLFKVYKEYAENPNKVANQRYIKKFFSKKDLVTFLLKIPYNEMFRYIISIYEIEDDQETYLEYYRADDFLYSEMKATEYKLLAELQNVAFLSAELLTELEKKVLNSLVKKGLLKKGKYDDRQKTIIYYR